MLNLLISIIKVTIALIVDQYRKIIKIHLQIQDPSNKHHQVNISILNKKEIKKNKLVKRISLRLTIIKITNRINLIILKISEKELLICNIHHFLNHNKWKNLMLIEDIILQHLNIIKNLIKTTIIKITQKKF